MPAVAYWQPYFVTGKADWSHKLAKRRGAALICCHEKITTSCFLPAAVFAIIRSNRFPETSTGICLRETLSRYHARLANVAFDSLKATRKEGIAISFWWMPHEKNKGTLMGEEPLFLPQRKTRLKSKLSFLKAYPIHSRRVSDAPIKCSRHPFRRAISRRHYRLYLTFPFS